VSFIFTIYSLPSIKTILPDSINENVILVITLLAFSINILKFGHDVNYKVMNKLETLTSSNKKFTADDFFIRRKNLETFAGIINYAHTLRFSGGKLSLIINSTEFHNFLHDEKNKAYFIFPNPYNSYVIKDFVDNILEVGTFTEETYKNEILQSINNIDTIINSNETFKGKIEYKFCQFAPSFGLQIIESTETNNDRIYVELYTIQTRTDRRYQFIAEKNNSFTTFKMFEEQFSLLWNKAIYKKEIVEFTKNS